MLEIENNFKSFPHIFASKFSLNLTLIFSLNSFPYKQTCNKYIHIDIPSVFSTLIYHVVRPSGLRLICTYFT